MPGEAWPTCVRCGKVAAPGVECAATRCPFVRTIRADVLVIGWNEVRDAQQQR